MVAVTHRCQQCLSCTTSYGVLHEGSPGATGHPACQSQWTSCRGCFSFWSYPRPAMSQSCSGLLVRLVFLGSCTQVNSQWYQVGTKHCWHLVIFRWTPATTPHTWLSPFVGVRLTPLAWDVHCLLDAPTPASAQSQPFLHTWQSDHHHQDRCSFMMMAHL